MESNEKKQVIELNKKIIQEIKDNKPLFTELAKVADKYKAALLCMFV